MIKNSSNAADRPDSLSGVVAAFEGIRDAYTLLNSPIGCKIPLGYTSSLLAIHSVPKVGKSLAEFYFGQSRLPCTFTDEEDFVYGSEEKIYSVLKLLDSKGYGLIGLINHSGTALIGDDLCRIIQSSGIKTKTMVVDSSGFTGTYSDGFKTGVIKILERLAKDKPETIPRSVNIIGPTVFHYNWKNDVFELKRTLKTLGVQVVSVICAGETITNLERAGEAALNLVVFEEYGDSIAAFLEKEYEIPSVGLGMAAPYGLFSSEAWFKAVGDYFHLPFRSVELRSKSVRMNCFRALSKTSSFYNLRGAQFAVFGDSSTVTSIVQFLYGYLGMYPAIVGLKEVGPKSYDLLKKYLSSNSLETSILVNPDQYEVIESFNERAPTLVFGSSIEECLSMMADKPPEFIPVSFPYYEEALLTMRPLMGFSGTLTLVEDTINSIRHYCLSRNLRM